MAICCQASSITFQVASSPLSTNHHLTLLSLGLDLYFHLTDKSLVETLVTERIALVTAETAVDLIVYPLFNYTGDLEGPGFSCPT